MLRVLSKLSVLAAMVALMGCSHDAQTNRVSIKDPVTSYGKKIPRTWGLQSTNHGLFTSSSPEGISCSAHTYSVDLTGSFNESVAGSIESIVERVDRSGTQITRGKITVAPEKLRLTINATSGMFTNVFIAEVLLTASVAVDGKNGRLFGKTIEASGRSSVGKSTFCDGGDASVKNAAEEAQTSLMRKIAEEIGNSERIRAAK